MSASGFTPISIYYSATASNVPTAANLVPGELAINTNDGKLYYEDSAGVVQVLASKATSSGTFGALSATSITNSGLTTGRVVYTTTGGLETSSATLTYDGTTLTATTGANFCTTSGNVGIGSSTVAQKLSVGSASVYQMRLWDGSTAIASYDIGRSNADGYFRFYGNQTGVNGYIWSGVDGERMRINTSGFVGINTASPTQLLHINSSSDTNIRLTNAVATSGLYIGVNSSSYGYMSILDNQPLWFGTNNTERLRITAAGNVGIGTTSPSYQLHVSNNQNAVTQIGLTNNTGGANSQMNFNTTDGTNYGQFGMWGSGVTSSGAQLASSAYVYGSSNVTYFTGGIHRFCINTNTEAMRLNATGNLSIGNSGPPADAKLSISNAGAIGIEFSVNNAIANENRLFSYNRSTSVFVPMNYDASTHQFLIGGSEKMRVDSSGNLCIGTTSTTVSSGGFYLSPSSVTGYTFFELGHATGVASGAAYEYFRYAGSVIGSITQSGTTAVLYNLTSDQRLKENIVDAPSGNIDDIKVRSFNWKSDGSHVNYGFIAQELVTVAPYAVHQPENPDEMMAVDYSKLVPMMIKEIQDLKQRITTLENK